MGRHFSLSQKRRKSGKKSQVVSSQVDRQRRGRQIQSSSSFSFQEMDGAVEADGIEISLVQQHAAQLTLEMVSKWSLEKGREGDIFHPPLALQSRYSADF